MEALGYGLRPPETKKPELPVFHTKKRGIQGRGIYDSIAGTFTLLAGCEIDLLHEPIRRNVRNDLEGLIDKDGKLISAVELPSPSAAASAVLGGNQNGWTEWMDENGRTLDSIYRGKEK